MPKLKNGKSKTFLKHSPLVLLLLPTDKIPENKSRVFKNKKKYVRLDILLYINLTILS